MQRVSLRLAIFLLQPTMASPSELFSCVDAKAILESPVNDSTAKNHWSFAKDQRFKINKLYSDAFYRIPGLEHNDKRKPGIGYGKKTDLEFNLNPEHVVPSPDTYNIANFVETNKLHHKGFGIGVSREGVAPISYIDLEVAKVPGPGRYQDIHNSNLPNWSFRPRVDSEIFPQTTVKIVPGPGTYVNKEALNLTGRYHLSKHPSSRSKVFNPPRSVRFSNSTTDAPGPGNYQLKNDLSNEGKYILSANVSSGKRTFMEGMRRSFTDLVAKRSQTPGPGSYRTPSDFGYYDSKKERIERTTQSQLLNTTKNCSRKSARTRYTDRT